MAVVPCSAMQGSYLEQFSSPSASMKPSTFKPQGNGNSGGGGYLDNLAPEGPPPVAPAAAVAFTGDPAPAFAAPPTTGSYLDNLKSEASTTGGSGLVGYLDVLRTESATAGSGPVGYLDVLRTESAVGGAGLTGYLDAIAPEKGPAKESSFAPSSGASTKTAAAAAPSGGGEAVGQEPVLSAIEDLNDNMVRNQDATIGVLKEINDSVKRLVNFS